MRVKKLSDRVIREAAEILLDGGIVCFPTDTVYGLLALARRENTVERLYAIRRPSGRPFLLLIPDISWVKDLGLIAGDIHLMLMKKFNATFIFYKYNSLPLYLTRGKKSLAVRLPPFTSDVYELLRLLGEPVVAPSANPEGEKTAVKIEEAVAYFGDSVDLYVDGKKKAGKPSTIVRALYPKGLRLVREGNIPFEEILNFYKKLRGASFFLPASAPSEFFFSDPFEPGPPSLPLH